MNSQYLPDHFATDGLQNDFLFRIIPCTSLNALEKKGLGLKQFCFNRTIRWYKMKFKVKPCAFHILLLTIIMNISSEALEEHGQGYFERF